MAMHTSVGFMILGVGLVVSFKEKGKAEKSILAFFVIIMVAIILVLSVLTFMKKQTQKEIASILQASLNRTVSELSLWSDNINKESLSWSQLHGVNKSIQEILKVPRNAKNLLASVASKNLDNILRPIIERHNYDGYIVIAPDYTNIASMLKTNVGDKNLLVGRGDYLQRAFNGETVITPPQKTDISITDHNGRINSNISTMFSMTPIYGEKKEIIAVLSFRMSPFKSFTPILELGVIGETGETYAFNRNGTIVSSSRFDEQLYKLNIIPIDEVSTLNLELRDPGVNLIEGLSSAMPRKAQPFTVAVVNALKGEGGINIKGYRDYRGVLVVGSWVWIKNFGIGVITEMDLEESYKNYNFLKKLVLSLLIGMVTLFIFFAVQLNKRKDQLLEKDKLFKTIAHMSPVGLYKTDEMGNCIYVNQKWCEISGVQSNEILGSGWGKVIHSEDRKGVFKAWKSFAKGEQPFELEYRLQGDHKDIWVYGQAQQEVGRNNKVIGYVGTIIDITERKEMEEKLTLMSQAIEQSSSTIVITDVDGNIEYANPSFFNMTGYSEDMCIGNNMDILNSKEHSKEYVKEFWDTIKSGKTWQGKWCNKKKNGTLFWTQAVTSPVLNASREITHFIEVKDDITDRKKLDEELLEYREHLEELVKSRSQELETSLQRAKSYFDMPLAGSSIFDLNKKFLDVNEEMCRLTGYGKDELLQKTWEEITDPKYLQTEIELFSKLLLGESDTYSMEKKYIRENGSLIEVEQFVSCIRKHNQDIDYFVSMVLDISDRKKFYEERERLAELKTEFLSTTAHELRTPLTAILGFSELMKDREDLSPELIKEFSTSINKESANLVNIINDLLDISKIEEGKSFSLNIKLTSLVNCVNDEVEFLDSQNTGHTFPVEIFGNPCEVLFDPEKIKQVLRNLYSNSIKYSEGGCQIATKVEFNEAVVLVSVSDKGRGMTKDEVSHIFDKFYRTEEAQAFQGTGLGMGIVQNIIKSHTGRIWVESEKDKGTVVKFELPRFSPIWRDEFSVQIPSIDDQHKELFNLIERLAMSIRNQDDEDSIELILNELVMYAEFHFKYEEDFFHKYNFPGASDHIKVHRHFKHKVEGFKYLSTDANQSLPVEIINFLYNWLTSHILKEDMEYSLFLKEKLLAIEK